MDELKGLLNLVLLILFVAATLIGPLVERWRKKKEADRRQLEGRLEEEPEASPAPAPAHDGPDRPRLPYENVLEEVFGSLIERRRRAAQEAALAEAEEEEEVEEDDPIRRLREVPRPAEEAVERPAPVPEPARHSITMAGLRAEPVAPPPPARRPRSLDELVFRNPRLSTEAKLLVSAEILGKPRGLKLAGGPR